MLGEPKSQFSLTRAALSKCGRTKSDFLSVISSVFCAALLSFGCASTDFPKDDVRPIGSYALRQEVDGLQVAVAPLTDASEVQRMFKMDLLKKNLLPVFVVATNSNPGTSFLLAADQFWLVNGTEESASGAPADPAGSATGTAVSLATGLTGYMAYTLITGQSPDQAFANNQNLQHVELPRRTLSPAGFASGYVYFRTPNNTSRSAQWFIRYRAKAMGAESEKTLSFSFSWPKQ